MSEPIIEAAASGNMSLLLAACLIAVSVALWKVYNSNQIIRDRELETTKETHLAIQSADTIIKTYGEKTDAQTAKIEKLTELVNSLCVKIDSMKGGS